MSIKKQTEVPHPDDAQRWSERPLSGQSNEDGRPSSDGLIAWDQSAPFFTVDQSNRIELEVCGPNGKRVVHRFDRPCVLIGQSTRCDLQLRHPDVSSRHAYLQMIAGQLLCVPLADRSEIDWATGPSSAGWLQPGEMIRVGPFEIRVLPLQLQQRLSGPDESELPDCRLVLRNSSESRRLLPAVRLRCLAPRKGQFPEQIEIQRPMTLVGRSRRCKLKLRHRSVSRIHCSLLLTPSGMWVADLLGRDGTLVDGQPVRFSRLSDGSELQVGRFRFRAEYGDVYPLDAATEVPWQSWQPDLPGAVPLMGSVPPGGVSEDFVLGLIDQFTRMQQQMFSQSHEQSTRMLQMMEAMQQGQGDVLREELARMHDITRELQKANSELRRLQLRKPSPAASAMNADVAAQASPAAAVGPKRLSASSPMEADKLIEDGTVPKQEPDDAEARDSRKDTSDGAEEEVTQTSTESRTRLVKEDSIYASADDENPDKESATQETGSASHETPRSQPPDEDQQQTAMMDRIRKLERERNSLWQKIMRLLS